MKIAHPARRIQQRTARGHRQPGVDARRQARAGAWPLLAAMGLLALGGCNIGSTASPEVTTPNAMLGDYVTASRCGDGTYSAATPGFSHTVAVAERTVLTQPDGFSTLSVTIPEEALAVGIVLQGSSSTQVALDQGVLMTTAGPWCLTTPAGSAPLGFNRLDVNSDGTEELDRRLLIDQQTVALMYPNDGSVLKLPAGAYTFPVASPDLGGTFQAGSVRADVYYKVAATQPSTLNLNLFVVQGVGSGIGIQTQTDLESDANLAKAEGVLDTVYGTAGVGLAVSVHRRLVTDPTYLIIDTTDKLDKLFAGYPNPPADDALNVFVVDTLAIPGLSSGVIGLASRVPGPFNLHGTSKSGTVIEYLSDDGTLMGYALAHELGHYLGLYHPSQTYNNNTSIIGHDPIADTPECQTSDIVFSGNPKKPQGIDNCPDSDNLMFPVLNLFHHPAPGLTAGQIQVIRLNPAVSSPLP